MLVIGAKGFAKEVLQVLVESDSLDSLVFYDDINQDIGPTLYGRFPILKNYSEAQNYFKHTDPRFVLGIGNPMCRKKAFEKFISIGGTPTTIIAKSASIGSFDNKIGVGCNIMQKTVLTNSIHVGKGVIINQLTSIGHDVIISDFVEICPKVSVSGNCFIGEGSFIGTGAIIFPKITIGKNAVIGSGSIITKNIPDNTKTIGASAVLKSLTPH